MSKRWEEIDKQVMSGRGDIIEIEQYEERSRKGKVGISFGEENKRSIEAIFGKGKRERSGKVVKRG